jgi:hypothetical protein
MAYGPYMGSMGIFDKELMGRCRWQEVQFMCVVSRSSSSCFKEGAASASAAALMSCWEAATMDAKPAFWWKVIPLSMWWAKGIVLRVVRGAWPASGEGQDRRTLVNHSATSLSSGRLSPCSGFGLFRANAKTVPTWKWMQFDRIS